MEIKYLYNSGFIIELEKHILCFDLMEKIKIENKNNKEIILFATHSHNDHFNKFILNEGLCILSDDIKVEKQDNIIFVKPYDEINVSNIKIKTFGSTDLGVSYLVYVEGKIIFHSGDLNLWYWENDSESTKEKESNDYKNEINKLKEYLNKDILDVAFVPVDTRLKEYSILAIDYFLSVIKVKEVLPMHFREDYKYIKDLESIYLKYQNCNINIIKSTNSVFIV